MFSKKANPPIRHAIVKTRKRHRVMRLVPAIISCFVGTALVVLWVFAAVSVFDGSRVVNENGIAINNENIGASEMFHDSQGDSHGDSARNKIQIVSNSAAEENGNINDHNDDDDDDNETDAAVHTRPKRTEMDTPLLIFTCERYAYLERTLATVYKHHPYTNPTSKQSKLKLVGAPIVISQDGTDERVAKVIKDYQDKFRSKGVPLFHLQHNNNNNNRPKRYMLRGKEAYRALSHHYKWAIESLFSVEAYKQNPSSFLSDLKSKLDLNGHDDGDDILPPKPNQIIILEEDIEISPDFFTYMAATQPLLARDPTLLAVSAYNDNGKRSLVDPDWHANRLLRSDFFPGLGWMLSKRIWDDGRFDQKWPDAYWDDWLRESDQRKGRQVIRPEVSRTFHFGKSGGASANQYGSHLDDVLLYNGGGGADSDGSVDWSNEDLSYLENDAFREQYWTQVVLNSTFIPDSSLGNIPALLLGNELKSGDVRIEYKDWKHFVSLARRLKIMDNEKAGVPRTAYNGIVELRPHGAGGNLLFLTPPLRKLEQDFASAIR